MAATFQTFEYYTNWHDMEGRGGAGTRAIGRGERSPNFEIRKGKVQFQKKDALESPSRTMAKPCSLFRLGGSAV